MRLIETWLADQERAFDSRCLNESATPVRLEIA